jgi:hypothetical protein
MDGVDLLVGFCLLVSGACLVSVVLIGWKRGNEAARDLVSRFGGHF